MQGLRRLFIPSADNIRVAVTVDMLLRHGYEQRDPRLPNTWRTVFTDVSGQLASAEPVNPLEGTALMASVFGISGTGKSRTLALACAAYPATAQHVSFPRLIGSFTQLVHLKVDVPSSGRLVDFVEALMVETDRLLDTDRFHCTRERSKRFPMHMLAEWIQVAKSHFLGLLVIDEIQNLFKIPRLEQRRRSNSRASREMTVRDDELLKCILTLTNTSSIPIIVAGTTDGLHALETRLSTAQRATTGGYHVLQRSTTVDDPYFVEFMMPQLMKRQWLQKPSKDSDTLRKLLYQLTAGIPRLYVSLWIAGQRCCMERGGETLEARDIRTAAASYSAPVQEAVRALLSGDQDALGRWEDL